ncbi:MAG: hypothetical protein LBV62_00485 [Rickettsiales bacterium]|nr:hypothetical protein [Rickettsiales bacterium]
MLYKFCKGNKIEEDHKSATIVLSISTVVSAAIGVGLAAAISAIFPGAMLGMGSAALAGAVIGAIAPIAGLFVIDKVNDYIISPIIEHFSSNKGYEPV